MTATISSNGASGSARAGGNCRHLFGELEYKVEFTVPSDLLFGDSYNDEAVKDYIWEHYHNDIKKAMRIKPAEEFSTLEAANRRLVLLDKITQVQRQYLLKGEAKEVFGGLLDCLLTIMSSEYGFIGEVKYEDDGTMYLQTHAITNIAWNSATQDFYENNIDDGLKFTNLNSLFGTVMTSGECMIANTPKTHPKAAGIPVGHPPLNHFLGVPFFLQGGKELNGMVGIANKPGGYTQDDVDFLEPLVITCSNLIQAYRTNREFDHLINTLEEKVVQRTNELEKANAKVVEAAKMQIEQFACMSHEIRTPLNCIVGLSSLLQDTQLNPFQKDSMQMIVKSGELLMAVVNDVLDYSKLQTGHMAMEIQQTSLQDTLDAVVHSIENKAKAKRLRLKTYYESSIPEMVETDSRRLQQILYNLLGNAIKFSNDDGVVELSVVLCPAKTDPESGATDATYSSSSDSESDDEEIRRSLPPTTTTIEVLEHNNESVGTEKKVEVNAIEESPPSGCPFSRSVSSSSSDGVRPPHCRVTESQTVKDSAATLPSGPQLEHCTDHSTSNASTSAQETTKNQYNLRFVVKDFGKGIAREDFDNIFKPFQQVSGGRNSVQEGTGLGLSITSRLVEGLGGVLKVDSELGEWTEFSLEIPIIGKPVDIEKKTQDLQNCRLFLINDTPVESLIHKCIRSTNINMIELDNCNDFALHANSHRDVYTNDGIVNICLVQEDLFDVEAYNKLADISKTVLITFGPKYMVSGSNHHFRSLFRKLPSVMLKKMVTCVNAITNQSCNLVSKGQSPRKLKVEEHNFNFESIRALIAEDNTVNQKVLSHMLKRLGVKDVDIVDNGKKAVEHSAVKDYDIVFMDMQMPVMGGLEATELIVARRGRGREKPHVVFVTAHATNDFQILAKSAGGSGFISKPFNLKAIQTVMESLSSTDPQ